MRPRGRPKKTQNPDDPKAEEATESDLISQDQARLKVIRLKQKEALEEMRKQEEAANEAEPTQVFCDSCPNNSSRSRTVKPDSPPFCKRQKFLISL